MADPPWFFGDKLPGKTRGAGSNYTLMRNPDICAFGSTLPPIADDAVLFLWRVASMPQEALDVVAAWGFKPKTEIVWQKETVTGKRHFGMGRIVRAEHETCLIAARGRPIVKAKNIRSTFAADEGETRIIDPMHDLDDALFSAQVGAHSAKPERIYQIIEELYDGPYLSVFDRRQRAGWTCIGDEANKGVPYAEKGGTP